MDWEVGWIAHFFASIISSERASDQLENSAGAMVTWHLEKSRTLIWLSTCVFTKGRIDS